MISETPAEPATAAHAGRRPRRPARRRRALSAGHRRAHRNGRSGVRDAAPHAGPGRRRLARARGRTPQRTAGRGDQRLGTPPPLSVPGSDGRQHVEYDLVVANTAATPVALTVVEVRTADGEVLLRLDGPALVAATQPLDGTSPTAEIPGSTAAAVVVDLGLAADQRTEQPHPPDRLRAPWCGRRLRRRPRGLGARAGPRPATAGHDHRAVERPRMAHREQLL